MPKCSPRPSHLFKIIIGVFATLTTWLTLAIGLSKLPFLASWLYDLAQDHVVPGCGIRKGPIVHYIDDGVLRVFWEGRCSDIESKAYFKTSKTRDYDIFENYEYTQLSAKRHLFSALLTDTPSNETIDLYVRYKGKKSQTLTIKTAPQEAIKGEYRIGLVGDSQLGCNTFGRILKTMSKHRPKLFVHLGDMVQHAQRLTEWQTLFFSPLQSTMQNIAMIAVSGNHDWFSGRPNFYFHDRQKTYFSLKIAGSKLFVLDSERESQSQSAWLEQELATSAKANFRVVLVHVPPYVEYWSSKHWKDGDSSWPLFVRKNWVPLFKKFNVDVVISGHQHNYQRGYKEGINYIISGGGGSKLDDEQVENHHMYKKTSIQHHFLLLDFHNDYLKLLALTFRNQLIDELKIEKKVLKRYNLEKDK